jgi:hypothetical protein
MAAVRLGPSSSGAFVAVAVITLLYAPAVTGQMAGLASSPSRWHRREAIPGLGR